jgi:hypothetical protein
LLSTTPVFFPDCTWWPVTPAWRQGGVTGRAARAARPLSGHVGIGLVRIFIAAA